MVERIIALLSVFIAASAFAQNESATEPAIHGTGRAVYTNDEVPKDYNPKPQLVTKTTPVAKPKFSAIDIHCHWNIQQDAQALLKSMDDTGVKIAVNLSGGSGTDLDHMLKRFHAA